MKGLKNNIIYSAIGSCIYSLFLWFNISVIAQLMSPNDVGMYALAMAIVSPLYGFLSLNLRAIIVTDKDLGDFSSYLWLRILCATALVFSVFFIALFLNKPFEFFLILLFISLFRFAESLSDVIYGIFQKNENLLYVAQSQSARGIIGFIFLLSGLLFFKSLVISVFLFSISSFLVLYTLDIRRFCRYSENRNHPFKLVEIKKIFWVGLPLGIILLINLLNLSIPRFFVSARLGDEKLGYFVSVFYFLFIGSVFVNAIGQASIRKMSVYYQKGNIEQYMKLVFMTCLFSVFIGIAGFAVAKIIGSEILWLIYGQAYSQYSPLLNLVMLSSILLFASVTLGCALNAIRAFKVQAYLNLPIPIFVALPCIFSPVFTLETGIYAIMLGLLIKLISQFSALVFFIRNNIYDKQSQPVIL